MNRNGIDELNIFLIKVYLVLIIINMFLKNNIIDYIETFLLIILIYRLFSKNISLRRKENDEFIKLKNKLKFKQRKDDHIYKKCPKCKKLLKLPLPYKRGIKSVICPKCKKEFKMLVLRREKLEIISKKNKN